MPSQHNRSELFKRLKLAAEKARRAHEAHAFDQAERAIAHGQPLEPGHALPLQGIPSGSERKG